MCMGCEVQLVTVVWCMALHAVGTAPKRKPRAWAVECDLCQWCGVWRFTPWALRRSASHVHGL